jgi:hypothetical protein
MLYAVAVRRTASGWRALAWRDHRRETTTTTRAPRSPQLGQRRGAGYVCVGVPEGACARSRGLSPAA